MPACPLAPTEARRRWAELLLRIFEVDPLVCPQCGGATRIVAFITESAVIDQTLTHRRTRPGSVAGEIAVLPDDAPGAVEPVSQTAHRPLTHRQNPEYTFATAIEFPIPSDLRSNW